MLSRYLTKLAKLGGYLARKNDAPPGNTVICEDSRGLTTSSSEYALPENLWVMKGLLTAYRTPSEIRHRISSGASKVPNHHGIRCH